MFCFRQPLLATNSQISPCLRSAGIMPNIAMCIYVCLYVGLYVCERMQSPERAWSPWSYRQLYLLVLSGLCHISGEPWLQSCRLSTHWCNTLPSVKPRFLFLVHSQTQCAVQLNPALSTPGCDQSEPHNKNIMGLFFSSAWPRSSFLLNSALPFLESRLHSTIHRNFHHSPESPANPSLAQHTASAGALVR